MKLRTWLQQRKGRVIELATKVRVTPKLIQGYASGMYKAADTAAAISAATAGEVSVAEIIYPHGLPPGAAMCPSTDTAALDPDPPAAAELGDSSEDDLDDDDRAETPTGQPLACGER